MLLLIIILVLLFGGGGGYYGWNTGVGPLGPGPAGGIVPILLVLLVVWLVMGGARWR